MCPGFVSKPHLSRGLGQLSKAWEMAKTFKKNYGATKYEKDNVKIDVSHLNPFKEQHVNFNIC